MVESAAELRQRLNDKFEASANQSAAVRLIDEQIKEDGRCYQSSSYKPRQVLEAFAGVAILLATSTARLKFKATRASLILKQSSQGVYVDLKSWWPKSACGHYLDMF